MFVHALHNEEVGPHIINLHIVAVDMLTDVFHALLEVCSAIGLASGDERNVVTEPTDDLTGELVSQMGSVVFNPPSYIVACEGDIAILQFAELAPQHISGIW